MEITLINTNKEEVLKLLNTNNPQITIDRERESFTILELTFSLSYQEGYKKIKRVFPINETDGFGFSLPKIGNIKIVINTGIEYIIVDGRQLEYSLSLKRWEEEVSVKSKWAVNKTESMNKLKGFLLYG